MRDCAKRIAELSGGKIEYTQAKEMVKDIDSRAKRLVSQGFESNEAVENVIVERSQIALEEYAKQRANIARNLVFKQRLKTAIKDLVDRGLTPDKAFQSILEPISAEAPGVKASFAAEVRGLEVNTLARIQADLFKEDLMPILQSGVQKYQIAENMWQLSEGQKPTAGDKKTQRIAEIFHEHIEWLRLEQNKYGADIEAAKGRTLSQRHDVSRMRKMGEDAWANYMLQRIDPERSFGGDGGDMFDKLRGAYRAMTSGIRLNDHLQDAPELFQFTGPSNLAKRLSRSRQIVFKDFASWKDWHENFGLSSFDDALMDEVRFGVFNTMLLKKFGTNPEAMLKQVWKEIKEEMRDSFTGTGIDWKESRIEEMIQFSLGKMNVPASQTLANVSGMIGTFENLTRLGGALASAMTDNPYKALEYQYQGIGYIDSYAQAFKDNFYAFKSKSDKAEFSELTLVYLEGMIGSAHGRMSMEDDISSTMAKLNRIFFKANMLTPWTDGHKQSMANVMAHHLGRKKGFTFAELDDDTKRIFSLYNINEADWDAARATARTMEDGRDYIAPGSIPDRDLSAKFSTYFMDRIDSGVLQPGTREQRYITMGTRAGTPLGTVIRLATRFKSFPTTVITRVWGRALYSRGKADVPAIIQLALVVTAFGYMVGMLKDLMKGRTPKDPTKPETIIAAIAQGGAGSLLADIMLQDTSGFGSSLAGATLGPTYSRVEDIFKIYSHGKKGEFPETLAARAALTYVPGNNWLPVQPFVNHIMTQHVYEELNPGVMRRMERNLQKTYGQELLY